MENVVLHHVPWRCGSRALRQRRGRLRPTPVGDGANCADTPVDYGDERRDERRGYDHEKEGEHGGILRHRLALFLRGGFRFWIQRRFAHRLRCCCSPSLVTFTLARVSSSSSSRLPKGADRPLTRVLKRRCRPAWPEYGETAAAKVKRWSPGTGCTIQMPCRSDRIRAGSACRAGSSDE